LRSNRVVNNNLDTYVSTRKSINLRRFSQINERKGSFLGLPFEDAFRWISLDDLHNTKPMLSQPRLIQCFSRRRPGLAGPLLGQAVLLTFSLFFQCHVCAIIPILSIMVKSSLITLAKIENCLPKYVGFRNALHCNHAKTSVTLNLSEAQMEAETSAAIGNKGYPELQVLRIVPNIANQHQINHSGVFLESF
jgi:hypothetical protein